MAKKKKRKRAQQGEAGGLIAQLQNLIRGSGKTIYQLAKESGVAAPQLYRFVNGDRTLTLPAVEKLCRTLDLELVQRTRPAPRKRPAPPKREEAE
jgi:hypothetical protein